MLLQGARCRSAAPVEEILFFNSSAGFLSSDGSPKRRFGSNRRSILLNALKICSRFKAKRRHRYSTATASARWARPSRRPFENEQRPVLLVARLGRSCVRYWQPRLDISGEFSRGTL